MTVAAAAAVLELLGIVFLRARPDLVVAGSPERSLDRLAVESADGKLWIVERQPPAAAPRKQEIARVAAAIAARLPEIRPWLAFAPGRFVAEREGSAWQVSPYVAGVPLDRPGFAFEPWRGEALADLLIRFHAAAAGLSVPEEPFSLTGFVRGFFGKLRELRRPLFERLYPALLDLERRFFPSLGLLPCRFSHGDFHPLNVVWSSDGVAGLVDLEFCGLRPETYDAALLVGCLGMEDPRALAGGLVRELIGRLRAGAGYTAEGWASFPDMVRAIRLAWLSDWLRRDDREMIELEAVYIELLGEDRKTLAKTWA